MILRGIRKALKNNIGIGALQNRSTKLEEKSHQLEARSGQLEARFGQLEARSGRIEANFDSFLKRIGQLETSVLFLQNRIDKLEKLVYELHELPWDLELARGKFTGIEWHDMNLRISGWMVLPDREIDSALLYINQREIMMSDMTESEDGARECPWFSHARRSGFAFEAEMLREDTEGMIDICVVGVSNGRRIAKMETWFCNDLYTCLPVPPQHITLRENDISNPSRHLISGLRCYREFWKAACKYADSRSFKSMLDWGCGGGRIIGCFLKYSQIPRICGCDIDTEAIDWCRKNLKPAEFSVVPSHPPTSYPDEAFDLIISFSVLTHLSNDVQLLWLEEMQRLLAPKGLFLATIHGEFATAVVSPAIDAKRILKEGLYDVASHSLDGIAPENYYRSTFQTKKYTLTEYSKYFEILEYVERGAMGFQDLIIMRGKN